MSAADDFIRDLAKPAPRLKSDPIRDLAAGRKAAPMTSGPDGANPLADAVEHQRGPIDLEAEVRSASDEAGAAVSVDDALRAAFRRRKLF
jgi:hypothetical protein